MEFLIFATLGLSALVLLCSIRRPQPTLATARPTPASVPAPRRIANPRVAGRPDVRVWVLRASPGCQLTQSVLDGRRYATEDALPLPSVGCSVEGCQCRYEPLAESRRGEQRRPRERRGDIRFQSNNERRLASDRRRTNGWQHAVLR